jgi:hypothetical protein
MRTVFWLLPALLIGMVLGGLGPKADLRQARAEIAQLKKQAPRTGSGSLVGITSMLRIPEAETATTPRRRHGRPSLFDGTPGTPTNMTLSAASTPTATVGVVSGTPVTEPDPATLQDRIQQAAALWKVRVDLARNSFVANVATEPELAAQFDAVIADMNERLGADIRTWVAYLKNQPQVTPETGIRMMSALSTDLVQTYEYLDTTMPADWRERAGEKFQVFDFIDPQVALPLIEVEDALRFDGAPHAKGTTHGAQP